MHHHMLQRSNLRAFLFDLDRDLGHVDFRALVKADLLCAWAKALRPSHSAAAASQREMTKV